MTSGAGGMNSGPRPRSPQWSLKDQRSGKLPLSQGSQLQFELQST